MRRSCRRAALLALGIALITAGCGGNAGTVRTTSTRAYIAGGALTIREAADFRLFDPMLPRLVERGGAIVNISSTGALISTGQTPSYGAAKAAVLRLTADLAVAYGRDGVRVNAIAPGNIYTPMVDRGGHMTPEQRSQRARMSALGTEGTAWDVAYAALFLASDEARWITGACLPVDGGMTQTNPSMIHRWLSE